MIKQVINSQNPKTLRIEYMIGNTCNHKCWYCFKGSNEGEFRWTDDFDATTKNFFHLLDHYKKYGKERLWKQNLNCTICGRGKYNPLYSKYKFYAICKICFDENVVLI